jgi:hypothetical protein
VPSSAYEEDAPTSEFVAENPGAPLDDGAPVGPNESEEASFLAEQRAQPAPATPSGRAAAVEEPEDRAPLPPLDELVNRVPPAARDLLEELFRAKFVTVKRVPRSALKG